MVDAAERYPPRVTRDPSVAVVVPHFGDPSPVVEVVRRLGEQQYDGPLEVVVVDDGSPTPLAPVAGARVVRAERNRGFGATVNLGARESTGEYVLILNSDAEPGPTFVRDLLRAALPVQPAVCGVTVTVGGVPQTSGYPPPRVHQILQHLAILRAAPLRRLRRGPVTPAGDPVEVGWCNGAALLVPRHLFETLGGFDEGYFMYWEDMDLQDRVHRAGVAVVWVRDVRVEHPSGASSSEEQKLVWEMQGQFRYFAQRGQDRQLALTWCAVIAGNFAYDAARRLAGRDVRPVDFLRTRVGLLREGLRSARYARQGR